MSKEQDTIKNKQAYFTEPNKMSRCENNNN